MNPQVQDGRAWPRRKWWGAVVGLFAIQLALLWWFGARAPIPRRPVSEAPLMNLADAGDTNAAAWLALNDPTLFARSHPQSFSGAEWMKIAAPTNPPPEWSEPPRWLALDLQQLGSAFRRFVQTNQPLVEAFIAKAEAPVTELQIEDIASPTLQPSTLWVEGALAERRLLKSPALKPWAHADLLTNSVVQVLVNGDGNVVAPVLLASSGKSEADLEALATAKNIQFEPLPGKRRGLERATALAWGTLVFQWQTLALTNGAAAR